MQQKNKLFAIFGNPVTHSLSPLMHNYALEGLGINGCYTRYQLIDPKALKEKFLQLNLDAINITVPHKEAAYQACDEIRGIAKEIGAINTIVKENDKLIGYNTDAPGFFKCATSLGKIENILILGAGGTAKALAAIFRDKKISVTILNRSASRLKYFKQKNYSCYTWEDFETNTFDLVVNTTSAGLQDEYLPVDEKLLNDILNHAKYAIDVIYNKNTPFLQMAKEHDLPIKDGSDMLLFQGVYAFELFFNKRYKEEEILPFMQKAFT